MWKKEIQSIIDEILATYGIHSVEIREKILTDYVHPDQTTYNMMVFKYIHNLIKVPVDFITAEMLAGVVDMRNKYDTPLYRLLPEIPEDIMYNLFRELVGIRSSALNQLPERFINDEFIEIAKKCPLFIPRDLPPQYQSCDIWKDYLDLMGIDMTDEMLTWIPDKPDNFDYVIPYARKNNQLYESYVCVRDLCSTVNAIDYNNSELVKMAIRRDIKNFHLLPCEFLTHELCMYALAKGTASFIIPEKFRSYEIYYNAFIYEKQYSLSHVPDKFRDFKMCKFAIECNYHNFLHVPSILKTRELCQIAVSNGVYVGDIPEDFRTHEMYLDACRKYATRYSKIPEKFRTPELIAELEKTCKVITPGDIFNHESCLEFIKSFPDRISQVPEKYMTYEMYKTLLEYYCVSWEDIPKEYLTKEMYLIRVLRDVKIPELCTKYLGGGVFVMGPDNTVYPEEYYCEEFFHELCIRRYSKIKLWQIPVQFRTAEICNDFFLRNPKNIEFVPEKFITPKMHTYLQLQNNPRIGSPARVKSKQ